MGKWELPNDPFVLGQLLALLAHDLRNPLSALHSNLGYLQDVAGLAQSDPEVAESMTDGLISCDGLSHIIDNVDFLAQALREMPRSAPLPRSAEVIVRDAIARCETLARSHGISLSLTMLPGSEGFRVSCSREILSRALANLIRNSIQFSPSGTTVEVTVALTGSRFHVELQDSGQPLPSGSAEVVFGLDAQIASKAGGDGRYSRWLGLFIAALAAEQAGGFLEVVEPSLPFTSALRLDLPIAGPS